MKTVAVFLSFAPAVAQDLFLAVAKAKNDSCVPDYQCGGSSKVCCSGRSYFVLSAAECAVGGKSECQVCQEVVGEVVKELEGETSCADVDATKVCDSLGLSGSFLGPLCTTLVTSGCAQIQPYISKHLTPEAICDDAFSLCPGKDSESYYCGCLPAGECVDPLGNPSGTCCSGHWKYNFGAICGKNHHNLPAPAQCT